MSRCWLEGEWRAYLDGELEPVEIEAARQHLESCATCAMLFEEVEGRAHRVAALMSTLDRIPERPTVPRRAVARGRRAVVVALALAAALAVGFVMLSKPTREARPVPAPMPAPVASVVEPPPAPPVPAKPAPPRLRATPKARVDYYLGLDSDPIETGVVVRVALDSGLLADVIVDEQGRPRAVRPVNYEESRR